MTVNEESSVSAAMAVEPSTSAPVIAGPSASGDIVVEPAAASSIKEEPSDSAYDLTEWVASSSLIKQETTTNSTPLGPLSTFASQKRDFGEITENSHSQREDRKTQILATPRLSRNKGKETAIRLWADMVGALNEPVMVGTLNGPNIRRAEAHTLEGMVLFGIAGALSEGMEEKFASNREDNRNYLCLNAIPNAMEYLKRVLKAESPSEAIGRCVEKIDVSTYNGQFLTIMRGTLYDFCITRLTKPNFEYTGDYEMTYWVDSVLPMFRYLARITGLVLFNWGQTVTMRIDFASYFDDIQDLGN
ncbi:hypothetical protein K450DRAFT_259513 [Umbelopsis ramanniana AG]|uniref:Uncharacterized protein n=1 Tax=Umbelopsis ramanniana AG TaxID=1314678 RepID=A0AAD5HAU5_UMBRA|nr:uncharacterized protein K450DRAFT_259513 [Umbelopsis ramanniana AG]KAI8575866.1 hypothetical protein K450DRAFT_259513 [Umbelopsis ramanniana AG]